jgi:hypothetical protein
LRQRHGALLLIAWRSCRFPYLKSFLHRHPSGRRTAPQGSEFTQAADQRPTRFGAPGPPRSALAIQHTARSQRGWDADRATLAGSESLRRPLYRQIGKAGNEANCHICGSIGVGNKKTGNPGLEVVWPCTLPRS